MPSLPTKAYMIRQALYCALRVKQLLASFQLSREANSIVEYLPFTAAKGLTLGTIK